MKQRTHVVTCVLVPLLCGCAVTAVVSWLPIILQYYTWIDSAVDDIVNRELAVLLNVSFHIAQHSRQFVQTPANFVQLSSSLMAQYYSGNLHVKPAFRGDNNYVSAVTLALQDHVAENYSLSMWYLNPTIQDPSKLPLPSQQHLQQAAIFDSFARPSVDPFNPARAWQAWYGFASDGLAYSTPAASYSFWVNYTGDSKCPYSDRQYDPRCRPWFAQTAGSATQYVPTITDPYMVLWQQQVGQSVCSGVSRHSALEVVFCIDYDLQPLLNTFQQLRTNNDAYGFALSADGSVFFHPKLNRTLSDTQSILELEFGGSGSREARDFNDSVLPYFLQGAHVVTKYKKDGNTMLLSIAPVNVMLSGNRLFYRILSVGVVVPKEDLTKKVESLKRETGSVFLAEVLIFSGVIVGLLVCGWL